jgi:hypothetical protein
MTDADALEAVIARTGHVHYRILYRDDPQLWGPELQRHARGEPLSPSAVTATAAVGATEFAPSPPPAPHPRRTRLHVLTELVTTNAFYCRQCATGCQQSRCLAGFGDEYGRAPLLRCVACLTNHPTRPQELPQ